MARRTKEEAQKTREAILAAAIDLFAEKGVSATTLANIAKQAGVTRGAVYWHFKNKDDLINALKEMLIDPVEKMKGKLEAADVENPLEVMFSAQLEFFNTMHSRPILVKLVRIFLTKFENAASLDEIFTHKAQCHREGLNSFEIILGKAVEQQQLPEDFNIHTGALASIAFFDGLIYNWAILPKSLTMDEEIPTLLQGFNRMLKQGF